MLHASLWATAFDAVDTRELQIPLSNKFQRWERLRRAAKLTFDGSVHAFPCPKYWASAHILPRISWSWQPVSEPYLTSIDIRRSALDVELDELITESLMYPMPAIQHILNYYNWSETSTVVVDPTPFEPATLVPWDSLGEAESSPVPTSNQGFSRTTSRYYVTARQVSITNPTEMAENSATW